MSSGVGKEVVDASSVVTKGDMKDLLENLLKMGMIGPKSVAGGFELKLELMPNELRLEWSKNYLSWCRRAQLMLRAKGVDHFLQESCEEPSDKESQAWRMWNTTNSTVVSWLMTSVAPSISRMIETIQNAAIVWKTLSNMYSGEGNVMMMVEAQNKVENLKQEGRTVQEYASEL
jgi:hypothetical protein